MHQVIKLVGVSPEALVALHHAIKAPWMLSSQRWGQGSMQHDGRVPFVELLSAKLDINEGEHTRLS